MSTDRLRPCVLLLMINYIIFTSSSTNNQDNLNLQSTRILFGSCSKPYMHQPLWPSINAKDPDIWIWGGDIVYLDRPDRDCIPSLYNYLNPFNIKVDKFHCRRIGYGPIEPSDYDYYFNLQLNNPGYQQLLQNPKTSIIGIWDDHDYAANDGCYDNPYKNEAKQALMKFLDIPKDSPVRSRDGMYQFHTFTFDGNLVIDIYLMDIRWFSDPKNDIIFGDKQWQWLENKMKERSSLKGINKPNMSIFLSGVQILPYYRGYWSEAWAGKSKVDRMKFMEAVLNYNVSNAVLLSGDVHWGEQMRYNCMNKKTKEYKSLYEMTSSGLTHSWSYTYPAYWTMMKNIGHALSADGAIIGLTNDLNFGEIEVIQNDVNMM